MKRLPVLLCILLLTGVLIPSCEVENCPPNALSYLHFSLVDQNGRTFQTSDTITIVGQTLANDSLVSDTLINQETAANSFTLPLSYDAYTQFIFVYHALNAGYVGRDTIQIDHRNIPYFTNLDCGTMMFYEITNVGHTHHRLDSIAITNPNIDNNEKENIRIYFTVSGVEQ